MADYKYIGLVTYVPVNDRNEERLSVLGEAIDALQHDVPKVIILGEYLYDNVIDSAEFKHLYENDVVCFPDSSELPENTPSEYLRASINTMTIKGIPMYKVYIPAVAKDKDRIDAFIYKALYPVLQMLFGKDLLTVRTRESIEYEDFNDAKEIVLHSVEQKEAVPA